MDLFTKNTKRKSFQLDVSKVAEVGNDSENDKNNTRAYVFLLGRETDRTQSLFLARDQHPCYKMLESHNKRHDCVRLDLRLGEICF